MGDWLVWLLLGSLVVILFCIYSLSSQVERCIHLAVDIITGNQRKIIEQIDALTRAKAGAASPVSNVVPFDRRTGQRRRSSGRHASNDERRNSPGRRREDRLVIRT